MAVCTARLSSVTAVPTTDTVVPVTTFAVAVARMESAQTT